MEIDLHKILNNFLYKAKIIKTENNEISEESIKIKKSIFDTAKQLKKEINTLTKYKEKIENECKSLLEDKEKITNYINDSSVKLKIAKVIDLEEKIDTLSKRYKKLNEDISKLTFQKEMLSSELDSIQDKIDSLSIIPENSSLSIEYIDSLGNGLDFEKTFAIILEKLNYTDVKVTTASGDFGVDVIAYKDDIKYGFQCKLYSSPVGNEAVQQAYAGKKHYNCNIAIVVTNNTFTEQAKEQAKDVQVILWDRNTLKRKINEYNKNTKDK